jgi:hypothetical protein
MAQSPVLQHPCSLSDELDERMLIFASLKLMNHQLLDVLHTFNRASLLPEVEFDLSCRCIDFHRLKI